MKNKILAITFCLGIAISATGCVSQTENMPVPETATTSALTDTTQPEETTAQTNEAADGSAWEIVAEKQFDFKSNLIGYSDENNAISVGYAGEIHYFSPDATDWPKSDNGSLCRFGLDIVDETTCYTCGNGGQITKSEDGGKTFVKKAEFGFSSPNACKLISFCDKDNGIVAAKIRLAITSDGAESWTELNAPTEILAVMMKSPEIFYCVGNDYNFYTTEDGGQTWTSTPLNLPGGTSYQNDIQDFAFSIDGDGAFTIFCVETENFTVKSYSTEDNWKSVKENSIPEIKAAVSALYITHDGSCLTVTEAVGKKATALSKTE